MKPSRDDMLASLKAIVVPHLRTLGFKGSMPHFHRDRSGHVDLLTFQFSQYGGKFIAEASFVGRSGQNTHPSRQNTPPCKMRVAATGHRHRIGKHAFERDPWPTYDGRPLGAVGGTPDELSRLLVDLIDREGSAWWDDNLTTD